MPFKPVTGFLSRLFSQDRALSAAVKQITGLEPQNVRLYRTALTHTSVLKQTSAGRHETNERLEFLGDAILGAVVAEFLYKKFPYKQEGFLTEIRSRIVNREMLNSVAIRIGLNTLVKTDQGANNFRYKSINGNALEALVGAIYLDKGYKTTRRFILDVLVKPHIDVHTLVTTTANFKSKLIEWAQSQNKAIRFEIVNVKPQGNVTEFTSEVFLNDEPVALGHGHSKKRAEQAAAEKALQSLDI
ncbi:ribonuclease III [Adhaeribacter sp. BT258]|uniref:Ribonuclease 3 n=1 Tax=Adhaeribacter terrigena TaxID=2793070 RepID=A0ABS1C896_9BACT|nr:ribonuclease III [Adhaeribacter terrigena]MBK0404898.1 ribonuclease III [Adhaeribacter terrigena]